jgi:hypothetical protein
MEAGIRHRHLFQPDVRGKNGIHRPTELDGLPPLCRDIHRGDLPRGMHAGVGATRSHDCPVPQCEALNGSFHLSLNGSGSGLDLPAGKVTPVIMKGEA